MTASLSAEELERFLKGLSHGLIPHLTVAACHGNWLSWCLKVAATITDLQSQLTAAISARDEAVAREAVLVGEVKYAAEIFRRYEKLHAAKNPPDMDKASLNAAVAVRLERSASDLPAATSAHLTEHEALKANQRTPGTVEVCSECGDRAKDGFFAAQSGMKHPAIPPRASGCVMSTCPIRSQGRA